MITAKRFIAGAVCPKCGVMDRLRLWRDDEREYRQCISCNYEDAMRLDGASEPAELKTRVNQAQGQKAPAPAQIEMINLTGKDD